MKKYITGFLSLVLLVLLFLSINVVFFRPFNLNLLYLRSFVRLVAAKPEMLSSLHFLEQYGIKSHQAQLDDLSEAGNDRMVGILKEIQLDLKTYDISHLKVDQKNNYDVFARFIADSVEESDRWRYHNYPLNQLFGLQSDFPSFMDSSHQIETLRDAEDYVARLSKVKIQFAQAMEGLAIRERKGIIPPRFVIVKVLAEMKAFVGTAPEKNILYESLARKLIGAKFKEADQSSILGTAKEQIVATVYPAYQTFIDYYEILLTKANDDDGVWKLPDGDAFYSFIVRQQTTTDLDPEAIHAIGLDEVRRIEGEMKVLLEKENIATATVGEGMKKIAEDSRFYFPDTDAGRRQILDGYNNILTESSKRMEDFFDLKPQAALLVRRIPEFKEKTSPGGYFEEAALDGSRPGTFFANLYDIKATPTFGMRTLAYHEGIPGHHFQISLAQENKNLAFFRKIISFTAYIEGWALYAEQLGFEAGLESDPFDNLGRLQSELFRSVRLVVDTGIHRKHWTRQQAITYMIDHTGMAESEVVAEIERYIVMPGQACSYKIGMLKILELRARAQAALGKDFSIKEFHNQILGGGALPLNLLERNVDSWIADRTRGAPSRP